MAFGDEEFAHHLEMRSSLIIWRREVHTVFGGEKITQHLETRSSQVYQGDVFLKRVAEILNVSDGDY